MAYSSIKQGAKEAPHVVEYVADTEADVANLPTHVAAGSTCIVIEGTQVYMLNNEKTWVPL